MAIYSRNYVLTSSFTLTGIIADLSDYKDDSNVISCRVYQEAI